MTARDMPFQAGAGGISGGFQAQFLSSSSRGATAGLETPYVVFLRRYLPLAQTPQALWKFTHPSSPSPASNHNTTTSTNNNNNHNKRYARVTFAAERTGCMHGFAGYFDCDLFGDRETMLSIVPSTHSEGMFSWFPMYFPLIQPIDVQCGDTITIDMWRCVDDHRVWYEWCVVSPTITVLHNVQGRASCVGL
jgi:protein arginine N-methyltransferase 5